eukprot:XP_014070625.1 PREDICTED: uncharacterized protein LOC106613160 [Salmo salar]
MGSSGYGSHGSNGSHGNGKTIENRNVVNEPGKSKPRTFQEICKRDHMLKSQDQQVYFLSPSLSPSPSSSKPESRKTTDTGTQQHKSPVAFLKDSVVPPLLVKDSTATAAASVEELTCNDQTVYSYQQISCLDSFIRYLESCITPVTVERKYQFSSYTAFSMHASRIPTQNTFNLQQVFQAPQMAYTTQQPFQTAYSIQLPFPAQTIYTTQQAFPSQPSFPVQAQFVPHASYPTQAFPFGLPSEAPKALAIETGEGAVSLSSTPSSTGQVLAVFPPLSWSCSGSGSNDRGTSSSASGGNDTCKYFGSVDSLENDPKAKVKAKARERGHPEGVEGGPAEADTDAEESAAFLLLPAEGASEGTALGEGGGGLPKAITVKECLHCEDSASAPIEEDLSNMEEEKGDSPPPPRQRSPPPPTPTQTLTCNR